MIDALIFVDDDVVLLVSVKVYTLTQRTEELEKDRDRVRLALERTEAAMIGYRERAHQQEQSGTSHADDVSVTLLSELGSHLRTMNAN